MRRVAAGLPSELNVASTSESAVELTVKMLLRPFTASGAAARCKQAPHYDF